MNKLPNFLFIMTDQQRADHLGCYGNKLLKTPNIDSLANKGTKFNQFYVANPVCMCNRASILTGRMPSLHGVRHNGIPLSRDESTFVELLQWRGYQTALIGKSHIQNMTGLDPIQKAEKNDHLIQPPKELSEANKRLRVGEMYDQENRLRWQNDDSYKPKTPFYGFDKVTIADGHGDNITGDYEIWLKNIAPDIFNKRGPQNAIADNRYNSPQAWRTQVPEKFYSTNYIAEQCEQYLEKCDKDKPFFLTMSFPDPHHPFTPPGKYWDMYNPDDIELPKSFGLGDIPPLKALREALENNTDQRNNQNPFAVNEREAREIIALTYGSISMIDDAVGKVLSKLKSLGLDDNTIICFTSDHGDYMGDHGLMLKLLMHYQGIIKVPFIWYDPRDPKQACEDNYLRSSIDIAPTFLESAGIQPYAGIQGKNILVEGNRQGLIIEEDSQRTMIGFDKPQRIRTYLEKNWRLSIHYGEDWNELYDLKNDPLEIHNLWGKPEYATEQSRLIEAMLLETINLQDRSPLPTALA